MNLINRHCTRTYDALTGQELEAILPRASPQCHQIKDRDVSPPF